MDTAQIFENGEPVRRLAVSTLRKLFVRAYAAPTIRICANDAQGSFGATQGCVSVRAIHAAKAERTKSARLYNVPNHGSCRLKSRISNVPRKAIQQIANGLLRLESNT